MSKNIHLVFAHGWGFSASFWQFMQKELSDFSIHLMDLGFLKDNKKPSVNLQALACDPDKKIIAIGHSLGFNYIIKNFPIDCDHYISINGFTKFTKNNNFRYGIAPRIIERMIKGLEADGERVLQHFYQQCGAPHFMDILFDQQRLQEGLSWLQNDDCRYFIPKIKQKLTIIASTHDPIVSEAMTRESFIDCHYHWIKDETHVLPLTQVNYCARIIRDSIEDGPFLQRKNYSSF